MFTSTCVRLFVCVPQCVHAHTRACVCVCVCACEPLFPSLPGDKAVICDHSIQATATEEDRVHLHVCAECRCMLVCVCVCADAFMCVCTHVCECLLIVCVLRAFVRADVLEHNLRMMSP